MQIRQVNRIYYLVGYTLEVLNSQDPVTGGGKYDLKDNTKAREHTRKATLRPDPRSRPRIHKLEYSLRIRNHPRTQSEDFPLLLHPIPTSRQDTQASPLELFGSYRESKIPPYRRVHKVRKVQQNTDHRGTPSVSRCLGAVGKLDLAISQILLIPLHHNGARARIFW